MISRHEVEWKDAPESKIHDSIVLLTLRIMASPVSSVTLTDSFLPLDSVCKAEEVDASPDSLRRISSLSTRSRTSSNFNLLFPDELLTDVCAIDVSSVIRKLNNRLIKCTLFEADGFSYILERAAIRLAVVFSFAMLKATLRDNVSRITPRACLSRRVQSSFFMPSGCFPERAIAPTRIWLLRIVSDNLLEAEKEAGQLEYRQSLERLSNLEREVSHAQEDSLGLNERASQAEAEAEVLTLKDSLAKLEAEREANLDRYQQCLEKIDNLENCITHALKDAGELNERASKAGIEVQALKQDLARVEAEKKDALTQYKQCTETISNLEHTLSNAEGRAGRMTERAEKAETELETLKLVVVELTKDKEAASLQYQQCLETISSLENRLARAQEEAQRLHSEIDNGAAKLKGVEERCSLFEITNQSMHNKFESLVQKMGDQSQELTEKQKELGRLWTSIQEERLRFMEAENEFHTLQRLHSQSQEELRSLATELQNRAQNLQDTETRNHGLVAELQRVKDENKHLDELNLSSTMSIENLQEEILSLRTDEKLALLEKLKIMEKLIEKNTLIENSLSDMNVELESARERVKILEEFCHSLLEEKSTLAAEDTLSSQLRIATDNLERLLEKNNFLENSLSDADAKLEGWSVKLANIENACLLLGDENFGLITQREGLISQLDVSQRRFEDLEKRYQGLEEKYVKDRESTFCEVEELQKLLEAEKAEHVSFVQLNETRITAMESQIHFLQVENLCRKKEYEEELDKATKAQIGNFILQKCAQDLEEKNLSLSLECRKLLEATIFSEKRINELELGNSRKQAEIKSLFDKITIQRMGLYQVRTLEIDAIYVLIALLGQLKLEAENLGKEKNSLPRELNVRFKQFSVLRKRTEKLVDMNEELESKVIEGGQREEVLQNEVGSVCEQLLVLQREYQSLLADNYKVVDEKTSLMKELLKLGKEKHILEEENYAFFAEAISQSSTSLVLKYIIADNFEEIKHLTTHLDKFKCLSNDLEGKLRIMERKFDDMKMENSHLKGSMRKLENELVSVGAVDDRLNDEVSKGKDLSGQKEIVLLELGSKTDAHGKSKEANSETVSRDYDHQRKETESIRPAHQKLEVELAKSNVELQKRRNEVELLENKAAALSGELQISAVQAALLEETAREVSKDCEVLERRSSSKSMEVEELERSARILKHENGELKAQLAAYVPAVVSLMKSVTSLGSRTRLSPKFPTYHNHAAKDADLGTELHAENCQQTGVGQIASVPDGFPDLQGIHKRIKSIEKAVVEMQKLATTENLHLNSKLETSMRQIEELRFGSSSRRERVRTKMHVNARRDGGKLGHGLGNDIRVSYGLSRRETSELDNQMLELWETPDHDGNIALKVGKAQKMVAASTGNQRIGTSKSRRGKTLSTESLVKELGVDKESSKRFTEPPQEGSKRKVSERLDSDAQKLANLQITVQDLKRKVEITETGKKGKGIEYSTVKQQLEEAEEAIIQLFDVNRKLVTHVDDRSRSLGGKPALESDESSSFRRRRVAEQARRGSEKIGRLQLEVQKIQFLLLKLDAKESKRPTRITERKTRVLLRDHIYGGVRKKPEPEPEEEESTLLCMRETPN
ncbi:Methylcrotonyl-CoA carboxylase alpha chai isoform 1 [Hibiscus syriacus]|uniref:Methylcrotonyl-CoA carboxylase alpha chai isoform 1 n=1 Tax=Hibiscus syriacus TaxID=106335 RepID=A0A6A3AJL9_HIBSY|nr:Methylcrotonyl-CoA carboxylase alpha chai isoform 1 [Hibiscus syriacus]